MKLTVDAGLCCGHGRCYTLAGGLLEADEEGFVTARDRIIDVPDDQLDAARNAAGSCPEGAVRLLVDRAAVT